MALDLNTDPSNNRAQAPAFNPTNSFSVYIDFQADTLPTGSVDPQHTLLANIGNDSIRSFDQFGTAPGWMIFLRPNRIDTFQKTAGSFAGATGAALTLPNPTSRHRLVVNWEFSAGQFRSQIFLDGSATSSAISPAGPMDFSGGATTDLLFGTNVDEAFQPPRTLDGKLFEVAIFDGKLTNEEIDNLASGGVQGLLASSDTQAPSIPVGLVATAAGASQIDLAWSTTTDNVAVTVYQVFRAGVIRATVNAPTVGFSDTGLSASTTYSYTVAACDAAGNCSAPSGTAFATTSAGGTYTASLDTGFNLSGNCFNAPLNVPATYGNQDSPVAGVTENVVTVWKWNATDQRWLFYSPQLTVAGIATYAASKGYDVLSTINPGDGYWVNALNPLSLPPQSGAPFDWYPITFPALPSGFNLLAHWSQRTPSEFNIDVSPVPPGPGIVPTDNFLTLWTWDTAAGNWYFYSPLLESAGGLPAVKSYAVSRSYLHFQDSGKKIGLCVGFWVNRP